MTIDEARKLVITFGKHRGKPLEQIAREDGQYIRWMYENMTLREPLLSAVSLVLDDIAEDDNNDIEIVDRPEPNDY